jgi:hypothetical protein
MESTESTLDLLTIPGAFKCKVSSVLNRSAEFQAKNMFEDNDSCWNSAPISEASSTVSDIQSQWILVEFLGKMVNIRKIRIMFQGGFVGTDGIVECSANSKDDLQQVCVLDHIKSIANANDMQSWDMPYLEGITNQTRFLKLSFPSSTDFYGRITIYRMEIWGKPIAVH